MKPLFLERIKDLMKDETEIFIEYLKKPLLRSIRANTLKISTEELKSRLMKRWGIEQPLKNYPEAFIIKSKLSPGEVGKSIEHRLGYFYVQEIASMMPPLALAPEKDEIVLDLCAAPGSKTTQMASLMHNQGTIVANDVRIDRLKALTSNLERCGVANAVVTRMNGLVLTKKLSEKKLFFDKILLDAPCSGEGTIRDSLQTLKTWNINMIKKFGALQKKLISASINCLKPNGTLVYSTCTFSPEENEEVIDFALKNFNVKTEKINLPLKTRDGIEEWQGDKFNPEIKNCRRIYPQDNDTEGFFVARIKKQDNA